VHREAIAKLELAKIGGTSGSQEGKDG